MVTAVPSCVCPVQRLGFEGWQGAPDDELEVVLLEEEDVVLVLLDDVVLLVVLEEDVVLVLLVLLDEVAPPDPVAPPEPVSPPDPIVPPPPPHAERRSVAIASAPYVRGECLIIVPFRTKQSPNVTRTRGALTRDRRAR